MVQSGSVYPVGRHTDWRLSNLRELESLVNFNSRSPALSLDYLFDGIADGYWSSTTSVYDSRYAWVLYTRDGASGWASRPSLLFTLGSYVGVE
jgi:Protein of unknown function (DUF1566)